MTGFEDKGTPFKRPKDRAKLFKHGGSQAVRLPKAYRFEGDEVEIRKEGDRVILEPVRAPDRIPATDEEWAAYWAELDALSNGEFPDREQPPMQERKFWW